jgi:hypothetical protein
VNSERPKRRFWQFHLSTALWLALAASGVLYINFASHDAPIDQLTGDEVFFSFDAYGWPLTAYSRTANLTTVAPWMDDELISDKKWYATGLLIDAATFGLILYVVYYLAERRYRNE